MQQYIVSLTWGTTFMYTGTPPSGMEVEDAALMPWERQVFSCLVTIISQLTVALLIGYLSSLVLDFDLIAKDHKRKMHKLGALMHKLQLPQPLRKRVIAYEEHLWEVNNVEHAHLIGYSQPESAKRNSIEK